MLWKKTQERIIEIVLNNEDSQMKSSAAWGLERIIRRRAKDIDYNGKIMLGK